MNLYDLAIRFKEPELSNVIFLGRMYFDPKVVEMKMPVVNPITGKTVEVVFAGASTRRQGLYHFRESSKTGQILGG